MQATKSPDIEPGVACCSREAFHVGFTSDVRSAFIYDVRQAVREIIMPFYAQRASRASHGMVAVQIHLFFTYPAVCCDIVAQSYVRLGWDAQAPPQDLCELLVREVCCL